MNLLTLPLVNPRHHIGKLKGFAYLLFEAFMRAYFDAYMKLLYPSCLVRLLSVLYFNNRPQNADFSVQLFIICHSEIWENPNQNLVINCLITKIVLNGFFHSLQLILKTYN